ncbi:hypothetical protein GCM10028778_11630 [Barrientosiimonas marina]|uniref:Phage tail protein n=1 Tax=Lentibacillus kimchii TaxID=1542911 RepID=A0ABW2V0I1_9BACI
MMYQTTAKSTMDWKSQSNYLLVKRTMTHDSFNWQSSVKPLLRKTAKAQSTWLWNIDTKSKEFSTIDTLAQSEWTLKSNELLTYLRRFEHKPQQITKSAPVFIYDRNETLQLVLSDDTIPYKKAEAPEELNGAVTISLEIIANNPDVQKIENEGRLVTRDSDGDLKEYVIRKVKDKDKAGKSTKVIEGEGGEYDLIDDFLEAYTVSSAHLKDALETVLQGTRWNVGHVDVFKQQRSLDLKNMSVRKAVTQIVNKFDGEVKYRINTKGSRITGRYIDVYKSRGKAQTSHRFEDGVDIVSSSRELDSTPIKTALYAKGKADADGNRLTFADVEWSKDNGDPVDKPKGQPYVGDPEALQLWGRVRKGGKQHKFGFYDGQEEDPASLLFNAYQELQKKISLNKTYDTDVLNLAKMLGVSVYDIHLGDTVEVINRSVYPNIVTKATIIEYIHNLNDKSKSKIKLGHFRNALDLAGRVNDVEKDYNENKGKFENKPDKIKEEVEADIGEVGDNLNHLEKQLNDDLEETSERLDKAEDNLDQAEKELADTVEDVAKGKKRIDDAEDQLDQLDKDLDKAKGKLSSAESDISDLNDNLSDANRDIRSTKSDLNNLEHNLTDAEKRINSTESSIDDLEKDLANRDDDFNDVYSELNDLDRALDNKVTVGNSAKDINKNNSRILGKNLIINGDTTVTGTIGAKHATIKDITTESMESIDAKIKDATIHDATITGILNGKLATIKDLKTQNMTAINATMRDTTISGTLDGNHATLKDIETKNMKAVDATIEDATVTGDFNADDATFNDLTVRDMRAFDAFIKDATIIGEFKGKLATIKDLTTKNMRALNATIKDATIVGDIKGVDAKFLNTTIAKSKILDADIRNAKITGRLDGATGTFDGTVKAGNIEGGEIEGVTIKTGTKYDARMSVTEQEITLYQGEGLLSEEQDKMHIGFRAEDGSRTNKPYMIWGYGNNLSKDKMIMEKGSKYFYMRYLTSSGTSRIKFNYNGSIGLVAKGTLHLDADDGVNANTRIHAEGFHERSSPDVKKDISKYDEDALNIVNSSQVYRFRYNHEDENQDFKIGLMANEAKAVSDSNESSISIGDKSSILWKAVQQLSGRIETLETKLNKYQEAN